MLVRKEEGATVTTLTDIPEESWKNDNLIGRGGDRVSPILRYRNRSGDEGKGRLEEDFLCWDRSGRREERNSIAG